MRRAGLLALAILLVAPGVSADETESFTVTEEVTLDYRVPAGCPAERDFLAIVTARTRRARFVEDGSASRRFVIEVRRRGALYDGRLVIEAPSGSEGAPQNAPRDLTSASCADLVRAFALFTAIAIDASAVPKPLSPAPSTASTSPTDRGPPARSPPSPAPVAAPAAAAAPVHSARKGAPIREWHTTLGSGVFVAGGIAESSMVSAHPVIDLGSRGPLLSPSVRLGLVWANAAAQPAGTADVALGLRAVVLSGCAFRVGFGNTGLGVRLCTALEGGILKVDPFSIVGARPFVKPWFAIAPLARLEIPVLPLLKLELEAGVAVPFHRVRAYVDPGPIVLEVGSVGVRLGADIVVQAF